MEKIGCIGYGAMGSMIIRGILSSGVLAESDLIITTRTPHKLKDLKESYPLVEIAPDNVTVARKSQKLFIFVNTGRVKELLEEIKDHLSHKTHIIYIAAGLTMENVEKIFPGRISKVIPSLTSEVGEGISLVAHNKQVEDVDAEFVEQTFKAIGEIKIVKEDQFGLGANLTSSAPAFISSILMKFTESALKEGLFTQKEAEEMVIETLYGTAKLLQKTDMTFEDVITKVATRGGITEEGLDVLDRELPPVFDELFDITLKKYEKFENELHTEYVQLNRLD
ncbi:pyrroline-5-carboxylate reductase dimerization domain-containing protein [Methanobacterium formicicum]|uniref:Pyrroline-5-carboxylate reductase n=1 Tax=Methanobacterium formicicum (strain DSM 3637 / PP1) TaxID=1204725 RepID=K2R642_METFP|nr:pyrroline-5-carboxylate reductase dimerization domain-containing protein [Methanobacterium formicicum]EKF86717.1 Pyrroline-5-carboxylate reductase [Methanobacterium formicicum DSM 3637]